MTAKKRDYPHHDLVQQYLPGPILNTVPGIIPYLGNPYDAKPGLGGMAAYPPSTIAVASRNKKGAPFQYAESPFAALAVVKLRTDYSVDISSGWRLQTTTKLSHAVVWIPPIQIRAFEGHTRRRVGPPHLVDRQGLTYYQKY